MELYERIALARKQAGLSQEQLGEKLGVSRQAVSKWESGQTNPDVAYLAEMCRLFGVSSDWLLLGEESAQERAPARCPGCQAIVTGLDRFCPNCGRSLTERLEDGTYTLVLNHITDPKMLRDRLAQFYREVLQDKTYSAALPDAISREAEADTLSSRSVENMLLFPPVILCTNASYATVRRALKLLTPYADLRSYSSDADSDLEQLKQKAPVDALSSQENKAPQPLSFGATVGAVVVALIATVLILSIL